MTDAKTTTKGATATKSRNVWSDEERAAMRESARERKAATRRSPADERAEGERDVAAKIAEMPEGDRALARRIHELVLSAAPDLVPRTYYGMPAYSSNGKLICFFKPSFKFKERYATLGFEQNARLDEGSMWPTSYALTELTPRDEERILALITKAVS